METTEMPPKILIAGYSETDSKLLESHLSELDYAIETARDGTDTLEKIKSFAPDLILLDTMMLELSGYEVCKKLKNDPQTKEIMILFITALNEFDDIKRAVNAGCDDFLVQPVNKFDLLKRVDNLLRLRKFVGGEPPLNSN